MPNTLFEQFRRSKINISSATSAKKEDLKVQLCFDETGAYISILNSKNEAIEPDYQAYSGSLRNLLRAMQQIKDRNEFLIDWENPSQQLYLHQHDYLLDYVRQCTNVTDERNKPVTFTNLEGELRLQVQANDKQKLTASIKLFVEGSYEEDLDRRAHV